MRQHYQYALWLLPPRLAAARLSDVGWARYCHGFVMSKCILSGIRMIFGHCRDSLGAGGRHTHPSVTTFCHKRTADKRPRRNTAEAHSFAARLKPRELLRCQVSLNWMMIKGGPHVLTKCDNVAPNPSQILQHSNYFFIPLT